MEYVVVLQPDGSFASLPAWMTEPAASRFEIGSGPRRFPLHILRAMRAEVDALLGFLLSESNTEAGDYGAQIRTHQPSLFDAEPPRVTPCPKRMIELRGFWNV